MADERERRELTDANHGFPGGPPHPPYGDPLPPATAASPEDELPAKPPVKRNFVETDKRKRSERKKKRREKKPEAAKPTQKDTARRLSKKQMLASLAIALVILSVLARSADESKDRQRLGAEGAFAVIPAAICRDEFEAQLAPDKEIPIAGAPTGDTPQVTGKGLGEVLWAVSLDGIVAPRTLVSRLTSTAGQVMSFARADVALFHRTLTVQGPDTNHLTAVDYETGDIGWQKVLNGWMLSVSSEHLWMAAFSGDDSSLVAAINMTSGEIEECFGAHAASDDDDPPLFEVFDEQMMLAYDAGGAPVGDSVLVRITDSNYEEIVQRLAVGGEPERLPIPTDQSFYRILSATESTVLVDTFDTLEGRDLPGLGATWTSPYDLNSTLTDSVAGPELALVHQSDYGSPNRRTLGLDPETGDELWRVLHPGEGTLLGGLHISGTDAAICVTDFTAEGTRTVLKTSTTEREIENAYLSFAAEKLVALIREPVADQPGRGTLIDLSAPDKPLAFVKEAVTILGATAEEVVVELDVNGAPWLLGISLSSQDQSESESGGGGGGGGGGDSEQEEQQGGGGGGGQGGTGDGGEGAPDV